MIREQDTRYFVGKFNEDDECKLSEAKKPFVVFVLDDKGETLTALYSNTDVEVGEKWLFQEFDKPATKEYQAYSTKKRKKKNPMDLPGQQLLPVGD